MVNKTKLAAAADTGEELELLYELRAQITKKMDQTEDVRTWSQLGTQLRLTAQRIGDLERKADEGVVAVAKTNSFWKRYSDSPLAELNRKRQAEGRPGPQVVKSPER